MHRQHLPSLALFTVLTMASGLSNAQSASGQEASPTLPGAELTHSALLSGAQYKVVEPVKVENYFGRFMIESKFGKFSVLGTKMLGERVSELKAIEELQKVQKDSAFKDAMSKSAGGVVKFAANTVEDPGKTVENVGKGIGTVIGRVGYLAQSGAQYVGDKADDVSSANSKAKPKSAPNGEPEPPSFNGDPFGYNKARREWAQKLGIDPYTSNPVLRPLLDDAATATFAGNFGVSLTLGAIMAPVQYAYEFDDTVRQTVWNKPPIDLEKENEAKLLSLGVQGRAVRDLQRNKWFTPTLQTALVARLEALGKMDGIESAVAVAAAVQGESHARFLLESLAILAQHHQKEGRFAKLKMSQLVPVGVTSEGAIIVSIAIDYGIWDKGAAAFAQRKDLNAPKKTLLVAGKLSPQAKNGLEKAGWILKTGLRV
ncbi:MAG: hypothetical protein Q8O37_14280 [Sulfuricellaceae bacterium]|nr:hypothetical protein [Sulfuricellaceae bacterium]